jgi:hypothetical protein
MRMLFVSALGIPHSRRASIAIAECSRAAMYLLTAGLSSEYALHRTTTINCEFKQILLFAAIE